MTFSLVRRFGSGIAPMVGAQIQLMAVARPILLLLGSDY
jgi:hypothetical protein